MMQFAKICSAKNMNQHEDLTEQKKALEEYGLIWPTGIQLVLVEYERENVIEQPDKKQAIYKAWCTIAPHDTTTKCMPSAHISCSQAPAC